MADVVDASAIVAVLTREAEAVALADRLDAATGCIASPIAVSEAALAICRKRRSSVAEARADVHEFRGRSTVTAKGAAIRRSSTWPTASSMRWRRRETDIPDRR
jgi:uncharacterized protein with PIN domain